MPVSVCRFNPAHTFRNPVALRRHYEQDHADVWSAKPNPLVRCLVDGCGKVTKQSNLHSHMMRAHNGHTVTGAWESVPPGTPETGRTVPNGQTGPKPTLNGYQGKRADINRCEVCGHVTFRRNMNKHFASRHPDIHRQWSEHVTLVEPQGKALTVASFPDMEPTHPRPFAVHADGNGYATDDFWIPVVHQLASPEGIVPVEAMAALGRFRDDIGAMLHAVTNLQPARRRR